MSFVGEAARAPDGRTCFQVLIHGKAFQFASANPPLNTECLTKASVFLETGF